MKAGIALILLILGVQNLVYSQKSLTNQLDSLEREMVKMDSIRISLEKQEANLKEALKQSEEKIQQMETELGPDPNLAKKKTINYWMIATVMLLVLAALFLFTRKRKES
jgi:LPXTG-motif cell wall-anchored protein